MWTCGWTWVWGGGTASVGVVEPAFWLLFQYFLVLIVYLYPSLYLCPLPQLLHLHWVLCLHRLANHSLISHVAFFDGCEHMGSSSVLTSISILSTILIYQKVFFSCKKWDFLHFYCPLINTCFPIDITWLYIVYRIFILSNFMCVVNIATLCVLLISRLMCIITLNISVKCFNLDLIFLIWIWHNFCRTQLRLNAHYLPWIKLYRRLFLLDFHYLLFRAICITYIFTECLLFILPLNIHGFV